MRCTKCCRLRSISIYRRLRPARSAQPFHVGARSARSQRPCPILAEASAACLELSQGISNSVAFDGDRFALFIKLESNSCSTCFVSRHCGWWKVLDLTEHVAGLLPSAYRSQGQNPADCRALRPWTASEYTCSTGVSGTSRGDER